MHAVQVAVRIKKKWGIKWRKEKNERRLKKKREMWRGWVCETGDWIDCRWGGEERRGEKRMWCKHLLIIFCWTKAHTSYSVTESEVAGTTVRECKWPLTRYQAAATCTTPPWHDLGATHDRWQHQDASQLPSTTRKLGHRKQHGAHSSTTLTFG